MYAQSKIQSAFNKYSRVSSRSGYTGAQVARRILDRNGLYDVNIEHISGRLTDHYDPRSRVLRLSSTVYNGTSLASLGVAAHEVGHAIQHADGYSFLIFRNTIAPIAGFGARFVWILIIAGFAFSFPSLVSAGILLYLGVVLFQIITLPVEYNASKRALLQLETGSFLSQDELVPTKRVLDAAALTYVAATLTAIAQLLRLVALSRRRD
ncbi:zinc metallopeptidase [Proteiniborus sp. MB09-C3]|uniref:zinc metallopeptidase n=1 Tax=Proteiniborus sp. MB09-C3 TaxID=3050072 RepID=UPI00332A4C5C